MSSLGSIFRNPTRRKVLSQLSKNYSFLDFYAPVVLQWGRTYYTLTTLPFLCASNFCFSFPPSSSSKYPKSHFYNHLGEQTLQFSFHFSLWFLFPFPFIHFTLFNGFPDYSCPLTFMVFFYSCPLVVATMFCCHVSGTFDLRPSAI